MNLNNCEALFRWAIDSSFCFRFRSSTLFVLPFSSSIFIFLSMWAMEGKLLKCVPWICADEDNGPKIRKLFGVYIPAYCGPRKDEVIIDCMSIGPKKAGRSQFLGDKVSVNQESLSSKFFLGSGFWCKSVKFACSYKDRFGGETGPRRRLLLCRG